MGLVCRFGRERYPCRTGKPIPLRTQAGFYARIYLHRLPPEDRDAALALLDETAAARRA